MCYCWFHIRLCQFHSHRHFFSQFPSSSALLKLLGSSRYSINYENHLSFNFAYSNWLPILQQVNFKLPTLVHRSLHNAGSQYLSFTTSLYAIASASLCLPQSPLPTLYQHCSCLLWFPTCFSLEFPPSSSQIYQLLHCIQIQFKNSPFL